MTLYTPAHFEVRDRAAAATLMHDFPFATLVTPTAAEPLVSHLPLLHHADCEPHGTLLGHFARANPHWERATQAESVVIFHGPHAYVSPSWYGEPAQGVPTWNYATVHALGTLETIADPVAARAVLETLAHRFEHAREAPWSFAMTGRRADAMVSAIVAFRLRIRRLDVKFKLSQNRPAADRARVIAALAAEGHADATLTADWMRRHAPPAADE
jgi:transcriptional regulator